MRHGSLVDVSDIFYFFSARQRGKGECEAPGGGGAISYGKSQEGGSPGWVGAGGEGPGGCLWGIGGGGGGLFFFFFRGRNVHRGRILAESWVSTEKPGSAIFSQSQPLPANKNN